MFDIGNFLVTSAKSKRRIKQNIKNDTNNIAFNCILNMYLKIVVFIRYLFFKKINRESTKVGIIVKMYTNFINIKFFAAAFVTQK